MTIRQNILFRIPKDESLSRYIVGSGILSGLHKLGLFRGKVEGIILLADSTVYSFFGRQTIQSLKKMTDRLIVIRIPGREESKSFSMINNLLGKLVKKGINRSYGLVTLGGGIISDVGGFIGSIIFRGIPVVHLPTTLLSQVDAAIGGKTGADYWSEDGHMYKNIIGSFHQPASVVSDVDVLDRLPKKEILNGLGEMLKYSVLWNSPEIHELIAYSENVNNRDLAQKIVCKCQKAKLKIVAIDPFDTSGIREKLNLGHTVGHALEGATHGKLPHGQAVAVGLVAAARISLLKGMLSEPKYNLIRNAAISLKLPVSVSDVSIPEIAACMKMDKKSGTFILIRDIGEVIIRQKIGKSLLNKVLKELII